MQLTRPWRQSCVSEEQTADGLLPLSQGLPVTDRCWQSSTRRDFLSPPIAAAPQLLAELPNQRWQSKDEYTGGREKDKEKKWGHKWKNFFLKTNETSDH